MNPFLLSIAEFSRGADFPVMAVTAQGEIIDINPDTESIFNLQRNDLVGKSVFSFLSDASIKKVNKILLSSSKLKKFRDHIEFITAEGVLTASLIFFPMYENEVAPSYFILSLNDPHKAAQLQIEIDSANRIADLNMKRLHNTNLKLVEARRAEQEAIKAKEHFFASISHEIRTPLNGILGITKLLSNTPLDTKQQEFINAVINSSEQLLNIINDLLDLSKINSFDFKFDNLPFNLQQALLNIVPAFKIIASNKKLSFKVETDPEIPALLIGDKYRLNQIINNLLNNAFKFTLKGEVSFGVKLLGIDKDIARLQFTVCDTGIGIAKQNLDKVFDSFTTVSSSTSKIYGGTGLGLSISKHLVELMKGSIAVISTVNKGTCFTFELPYPVAQLQQHKLPLQPSAKNQPGLSTVKILAVDDNEVNRFYVSHLFNNKNIVVVTAENGQECLELLKTESFDVILMDIQMPILDGYKTTERIRNKLNLDVPIIALTASLVEQVESKCLKTGMNSVIQKPFTKETLLMAIHQFVQTPEEEEPATEPAPMAATAINMNRVFSIAGDNKTMITELISLSLNNIYTDTQKLGEAIDCGSHTDIKAIAHKLKSTFGLYELNDIYEKLYQIEELGKNKKPIPAIQKEFIDLQGPIKEVAKELERIKMGT